MKYLSLILLLTVAGCDVIKPIDESIVLPEPVIIDKVDDVPAQPVPMPAPKQERPPVLEAEQPAPVPVREIVELLPIPAKRTTHWTYPGSTNDPDRSKLRTHLEGKPHFFDTAGWSAEQLLHFHDAMHVAEQSKQSKPKASNPAPVVRSTVQQYTIASCGYCKSDVRNIFPIWEKQGWLMLPPIDETANPRGRYPRYEIRGADGSYREFVGSLQGYK